jgi:hypothetical protein
VQAPLREEAMIIRQSINFAAHLLAGIFLGALVIGSIKARRAAHRHEPLEPRYPPPPEPRSSPPAPSSAAEI